MLILTTSRAHNPSWLYNTIMYKVFRTNYTCYRMKWNQYICNHISLSLDKTKAQRWKLKSLKSNLWKTQICFSILLFVIKLKQTIYSIQRKVKAFKAGAYSVIKSFKAHLTNKTVSIRIFKQTIDWKCESIGCFGLTASRPTKTVFKLFQKHLSVWKTL